MMNWTANELAASGVDLIYPLTMTMKVMRNSVERRAIIAAIADAGCSAIWLKVENFGDNATGEKVAAYMDASRDFHARAVPLVGDHVGGLPGLGVLAFGAVGGIAHGVTVQQNFTAAHWRRPRIDSGGGPSPRVYVQQLDLMLKRSSAEELFSASPTLKAMCGCRDTHCCPRGTRDTLDHPGRHAIYQRAREIELLGTVPQSARVGQYLNGCVRPASDHVARAASLYVRSLVDDNTGLAKTLAKKQCEMSLFRQIMGRVAESGVVASVAMTPKRRREKANV